MITEIFLRFMKINWDRGFVKELGMLKIKNSHFFLKVKKLAAH